MMRLSDGVTPRSRFSRSVNVERDSSGTAMDGYLPTGRALDVVRRVVRSLSNQGSGRAFSITGPHGSGKSSLAVFLGGLTAPASSSEFEAALEALALVEPSSATALVEARSALKASKSGFVRCIATAHREPVIVTVARSFELGARRFFANQSENPIPTNWAHSDVATRLTPRDIREKLELMTKFAPVLLLVDEFGKNLEAYSDTGRDGDPYLLQELAEWAGGDGGEPLVVVTMQHLAFEEYVHETSTARRREWVKVQGRFEDIAYVETTSQSQRLIASAFDRGDTKLNQAIQSWVRKEQKRYSRSGLRDLFEGGIAGNAYPIHPISLAALPELCSRYGQNERTLFSFLAGPEPQAVPAFLERTSFAAGEQLPFVRLSDVYDYFVASASTMISSSSTGGRWVEIESRIRDTSGLDGLELRALKSIGVLNLISAGGALRASHSILALALDDSSEVEVFEALQRLEVRGLLTYRDFADEYRIWQGSDFDLKGAVDSARRRCANRNIDELLNEAVPPTPLVAARHSQQHGTLRIFERRFSSFSAEDLLSPSAGSEWDGRVLLAISGEVPEFTSKEDDKPIVAVIASGVDTLREAAIDAAALAEALKSAETSSADWVARRELIERYSIAAQRLRDEVAQVFESPTSKWHLLGSQNSFDAERGPSRVLSDVADHIYSATPLVPNEMIVRRELSSQGAKARRVLIEAMLTHPASRHLGISGFPAERAMYDAVLGSPGLHRVGENGTIGFHPPSDPSYQVAWRTIQKALDRAKTERVDVIEIWRALEVPPVGLKDGPIPVLLIVALLLHQDDVALYEHGTLVLAFDDAVAERFVRNPVHFAVKNTAAKTGSRKEAVAKLAARLGYTSDLGEPTFLGVARRLFAQLRQLEPYSLGTKSVSTAADAMRKAFKSASEPDRLIFEELPVVFGLAPITADNQVKSQLIDEFVAVLGSTIDELRSAYPNLLKTVETELSRALAEPRSQLRRSFSVHASALADSVLEPRLKSFVLAACRDELDGQEWLENLAMIVADAQAPKSWNDDTLERFRLAATELGGAFRRVSALISERKALINERADTFPVAVTRVDGREARLVLWATPDEKRAVEPRIFAVLEEMTSVFGSSEKAREVLLAVLLDERDSTAIYGERVDPMIESLKDVGNV